MRLLEYEAKELLKKYGLPVPASELLTSPNIHLNLPMPVVIKAQIPKGGRGKAGGVQLASTADECAKITKKLLHSTLLGCKVNALLVEQALNITREIYLAITLDRTEQELILLAHKQGGVDIESSSAASQPLRIPLSSAPTQQIIQKIALYFELPTLAVSQLSDIVAGLWQLCNKEDALLAEVNPLVFTAQQQLVCADAKIELDDAAAFRHNWQFEAVPRSSQFVVLHQQGNVASMANGAGLAMATIDTIAATSGATPANFFDVGGGTNVEGMLAAFQRIAALPKVQAIVVNIFGGITRCDQVAAALITAKKSIPALPPLFIRLTGTNQAKAHQLLHAAGITTLPSLADCVKAAAEVVHV